MTDVLVFGSINVDLVAQVERLPGGGETVKTKTYQSLPGGKGANQALAAQRQGSATAMVGAVGEDGQDKVALKNLRIEGVDLRGVQRVTGPSGLAFIAVSAKGENQIVVIAGANDQAQSDSLEDATGRVLVTQNEVLIEQTLEAHSWARARGMTVVHNAAPAHQLTDKACADIDILVVNEHELEIASGTRGSEDQQAFDLLKKGVGAVVLTLGALGAAIYQGEDKSHWPPSKTKVVDTTGAGDAFVGALAAGLAKGSSLSDSVLAANAYAASVCAVLGAQTKPA